MNQASAEDRKRAEVGQSSVYAEDAYEHASPGLVYIDVCCQGLGADLEMFSSTPKGCDCRPLCVPSTCSCQERSGGTPSSHAALEGLPTHPIFECNSDCNCDSRCLNRVTQRGPLTGLDVVPLPEKGLGVVTRREIPAGAFVCLYAGEVIGEAEARRRFQALPPSHPNYILVLREHLSLSASEEKQVQTTIVDPTVLGNIGRYLNHSCDPNLGVVPVRSESLVPAPAMFSLTTIRAGEELCYSYDATTREVPAAQPKSTASEASEPLSSKPCRCSSLTCKGFLPANPSLF